MDEYAELTANEAKTSIDEDSAAPGAEMASQPAYSQRATAVVPQVETKPTAESVLTYQPQPSWRSEDRAAARHQCQMIAASADWIYAMSICWCIICCVCGSPLTLLCFIPAIALSMKVYDFAADGTPSVARMVLLTARIFTVTGIVAGIAFLVIHIILFATGISSDSHEGDQTN